MPAVAYIVAFCLGLCVGSFLNVCIYRMPRDLSLLRPGSHCPHCNEPIAWYDNLPAVSWILLGGLCRRCGALISRRYVLVELLTGAIFVWVCATHLADWASAKMSNLPTVGAHLALASGLIAASFVDIERMVIPDEISIGGMYVGPVLCALWPEVIRRDQLLTGWLLEATGASGSEHLAGLAASVLGMGIGAGIILTAGVLGQALFRKEAMGFGDVKFMGMIGAFIGWQATLLAFFVACVFGAVVGLLLLLRRRDTHIPFGPYLAAGALVVMLHFDFVLRICWDFPESIRSWFA